jgi:DNA-binding YbaB/EbfC family protein
MSKGNLMLQARRMQSQIQQLQESLSELRFEGAAGGGLVTVVADGRQRVHKITINPDAIDTSDLGELSDLVTAATNMAIQASLTHSKAEMRKITGGLSLPGLV